MIAAVDDSIAGCKAVNLRLAIAREEAFSAGEGRLQQELRDHITADETVQPIARVVRVQCDDAVKSEACLPLFSFAGDVSKVLGIMDAEASPLAFYTVSRQCVLVAAALVIPAFLPD